MGWAPEESRRAGGCPATYLHKTYYSAARSPLTNIPGFSSAILHQEINLPPSAARTPGLWQSREPIFCFARPPCPHTIPFSSCIGRLAQRRARATAGMQPRGALSGVFARIRRPCSRRQGPGGAPSSMAPSYYVRSTHGREKKMLAFSGPSRERATGDRRANLPVLQSPAHRQVNRQRIRISRGRGSPAWLLGNLRRWSRSLRGMMSPRWSELERHGHRGLCRWPLCLAFRPRLCRSTMAGPHARSKVVVATSQEFLDPSAEHFREGDSRWPVR